MHLTEIPQLKAASVAEKIELIDELWASIPPESVALPASHLDELAKRVDSLAKNPGKALSPDAARARIRARTGL
jgi:putative addiction module component (TIGR02574 family)